MKPHLLALILLLIAPVFADRPNILLICVDDLRPETRALGADYIHSPAMDSLVKTGRAFTHHYVQAPTCGASRYALMTGKYGFEADLRANFALMKTAKKSDVEPFSLPRQFRENGYRTVSVGKVSHYPGGLGGDKWNNPKKPEMPGAWGLSLMPTGPWGNPRRAMHGYADGTPRQKGVTPAISHEVGGDMKYTDGWITREALKQMKTLAEGEKPFFLAVGIMKPHLPFACPKSFRDIYDGVEIPPISHPDKPKGLTTWQHSGEFFGQYKHDGKDPRKNADYADELRRSYAACVSFADAQVDQLLAQLENSGLKENTIVVLWGDHGWHLGEHSVWGKHTLFEESLLAPLIIRVPEMTQPGVKSEEIVETIDIYPTLCELAGVNIPDALDGESLVKNLRDPALKGGAAISYYRNVETIRTERYRFTRHGAKKGGERGIELYDHSSSEGETKNLAGEMPDVEEALNAMIDEAIE